MSAALATAGRILLGGFFVLAGISKLLDPAAPVAMMAGEGFPAPSLLLPLVAALEIGGGLVVASGWRRALVPAALALAVFTVATNLAFHRFWEVGDAVLRQLELSLFFKNLAVAGGLLAVAGLSRTGGRA